MNRSSSPILSLNLNQTELSDPTESDERTGGRNYLSQNIPAHTHSQRTSALFPKKEVQKDYTSDTRMQANDEKETGEEEVIAISFLLLDAEC